MEGSQFDALSRRLGAVRSRRGALKAIAGAVVAGIAGARETSAQACTAHYAPCQADDQCCSGAVCEYGMCMPGCRIDGAFYSAWMSSPDNICGQCLPDVSTAAWTPANEGMSCWSGDPNAGATFCQSGECRATGPAQCPPPSPCHTDELIDPATCTYAVAPAGTYCGGHEMCHGGFYQPADTCDGAGFCIGGGSQVVSCAPYPCGERACLTSCTADGDCLGGTVCCDGACTTLGTDTDCAGCHDSCESGDTCVNGVCAPVCLPPASTCSTTEECCQEEATGCSVAWEADRCCRPLGGSCTSDLDCCDAGPWGTVYCSPEGVCGGRGATCRFPTPGACLHLTCCAGNPTPVCC